MLNLCLSICMVRTPAVWYKPLLYGTNPWCCPPTPKSCSFWSVPACLSSLYPCACPQYVASHYVFLPSFLVPDADCIITLAFLCYNYTVLYYLITLWIIPVIYYVPIYCGHSLSLPVTIVRTLCTKGEVQGTKRSECLNYGYCSNGEEQWV